LVGVAALAALGTILVVMIGKIWIPLEDIWSVLIAQTASDSIYKTIILDVRIPKAVTCLIIGAALGIAGAQVQTLFRNPIADPFVLGITPGAALGAAIVILTTPSLDSSLFAGFDIVRRLGVTGAAMAGAMFVLLLVLLAMRRLASPVTVIVVGVMFGFLAQSMIDVLAAYADQERVTAFAGFLRGSVRSTSWNDLAVIIPVELAMIVIAFASAKQMNLLLLGNKYAASMGTSVMRAQVWTVVSVAIIVGLATAFTGPIAFVGLAAPHIARGVLRTSDHRFVLPASALLGGCILIIAELIAQGPQSDYTLPINSVTSLIGAPVVLWVLLVRRRAQVAS
jgi:iron complex transport system permease protein